MLFATPLCKASKTWLAAFVVLVGMNCALSWSAPLAQTIGQSRAIGQATDPKACENCHDAPGVLSILHTAHARSGDGRTGFAAQGCQSCHGSSLAHMSRPADGQDRPPPEIVFSGPNAAPVEARNKACLGCHDQSTTTHWTGSLHQTSDVSCNECHVSHALRDDVLVTDRQANVCFDCHAEQKAAALRPSHHPVSEGRMACSDCHNPHGALARNMLKGDTVVETCLNCHDEKRGPFLWEHAPVQEDCTVCHTPHGSLQTSLLRQRPPYLCQNCHDSSPHTSQPLSGTNLPGAFAPARQLLLRGCVNCHSAIHGSNHPSGARLTR